MRLHDILRDEEAIAGGVVIRLLRVHAVSAFGKEIFLVFFCNADAGVLHAENEFLVFFLQGDTYRTCWSGSASVVNYIS